MRSATPLHEKLLDLSDAGRRLEILRETTHSSTWQAVLSVGWVASSPSFTHTRSKCTADCCGGVAAEGRAGGLAWPPMRGDCRSEKVAVLASNDQHAACSLAPP